MKLREPYYKLKDGTYLRSTDMQRAYYAVSGLHSWENPRGFQDFLDVCAGVLKVEYPTPRELFDSGYAVGAMIRMRELENTNLADAKEIIKKWEAEKCS